MHTRRSSSTAAATEAMRALVLMALISCCFSLFHLVDDGINCRFLKGLVPVRSFNSFLNFQIAFTGSGEVGDEIAYARHSTGCEGRQGVTVFGRPGRKTADRYEKGNFRTLALLGPKNIFHYIIQPRTCNGARNKTAVQFEFEFTSFVKPCGEHLFSVSFC